MISQRYYMIRAFYDWITDNLWTPYIVVDATYPNTVVPEVFVENGKVVLDVSFNAIRSLEMTRRDITFSAKFGTKVEFITVPIGAVEAIYAHENMQGMSFSGDNYADPDDADLALFEQGSLPKKDKKSDAGDSSGGDDGSGGAKKGPPDLRIVE